MIRITGSSNYGHGICCKPDYIGSPCNNRELSCSQPSAAIDTSDKYMNILTDGKFNYQMFAFLPKTNPRNCGISTIASSFYEGDMKVYVDENPRTISLRENNALKYREGRPQIRSYDSCYYEINPSEELKIKTSIWEKPDLRIYLDIKRLRNMNVYVYQGQSRYNATVPINENQKLKPGDKFNVNYTKGMLLIAYPDQDVYTEFEFTVQVKQYQGNWFLNNKLAKVPDGF